MIKELLRKVEMLEAKEQARDTKLDAAPIKVKCTSGKEVTVAFTGAKLKDLNQREFTVMYDPNQLELTDLCASTTATDMMSEGIIPGTSITILQKDTQLGVIKFMLSTSVAPGKTWSGLTDIIEFKGKINGTANITYIID